MSRILYKYLDIVGAKCMIENQNLQFTNASQLNDPFDCHPKLLALFLITPRCLYRTWHRQSVGICSANVWYNIS